MKGKDLFGYLLGLVVFVAVIPAVMFLLAGSVSPSWPRIVLFGILAAAGIGLSVWSIVYMRVVGKGNPMDAFDHEIGPRTSVLMTEGPYRLCRNPMLLGVLVYYIGVVLLLWSWKALAVFAVYFAVMMKQVDSEEKRLARDFGEDYLAYRARTKKLIPYLW